MNAQTSLACDPRLSEPTRRDAAGIGTLMSVIEKIEAHYSRAAAQLPQVAEQQTYAANSAR